MIVLIVFHLGLKPFLPSQIYAIMNSILVVNTPFLSRKLLFPLLVDFPPFDSGGFPTGRGVENVQQQKDGWIWDGSDEYTGGTWPRIFPMEYTAETSQYRLSPIFSNVIDNIESCH